MAYKRKIGVTKENPRTPTKTDKYRGKREPSLSP